MNDVDALIQMCCAVPADATRRGVLADKLAEIGESEIEEAIRSDRGEAIIREVHQIADSLKRAPCLRLLWTVAVVIQSTKIAAWLAMPPTREQVDEITRRWDERQERRRVAPSIMPADFRWFYDDSTSDKLSTWGWNNSGNSVTDNH